MPKQWTPENILNLFVSSPTQAASLSPDVSTALKELLESKDPDAIQTASNAVSGYLKEIYAQPVSAGVEEGAPGLKQAFRRSAAVLTAFNPVRLKPLGMSAEPGSAIKELMDDLVEVYDPPTPRQRWMLRTDIREKVLREMGSREQLLDALNATPKQERPATVIQEMLELCIRGEEPPLTTLPLKHLVACLQAIRWLQPSGLPLPSLEKVQEIIDQNEVPAIFEKMAGNNFTGREAELEMLREYVEVLPPSNNLRVLRRQVRRWFGLERKPPLVIYAPGGAGKTTLISKFLLEHMQVPEELKFPYVYLDFDNPRLALNDPDTIMSESVRQLSIQYPSASAELKNFLSDERATHYAQQTEVASDSILDISEAINEGAAAASVSRFANLVRRIVHRSSEAGAYSLPLLIVLDTYEEVQTQGFKQEIQLWNLMDSIQHDFPTVRIVVFGRSRLEQVPTSNISTRLELLENFDRPSAESFLRKLGVGDANVARSLYDELGGNPLSLKLAAEVYRRGDYQAGRSTKGWSNSFFFFNASEHLVQGQLYQRILGHIHDPEVRKLAHPGLILRRITPELIKEVLQKPCGIAVPDDERARQLFDALKRESALVTMESDGALRHRPDVRRIMLNLLARDKPEQTREINRLAVKYYEGQAGLSARAEEIYHRLQLGESAKEIQARWKEGVGDYLRGAIEELPVESRLTLASFLNVRLKKEDVEAAGLAEWERYIAGNVNELVRLGHYAEALKALRERKERTAGSPLHLIEARALALMHRWSAAMEAVLRAQAAASASGSRREMLNAVLLAAQLSHQHGQIEVADNYLAQAQSIAATLDDPVKQILALLQRMRMYRITAKPESPRPVGDMRPELARLLSALPDEKWLENRQLVRASVSLLGLDYHDFMLRMLRRVGFGRLNKAQISILTGIVLKRQKDDDVLQLIKSYAKTLKLRYDGSSFVEKLLPELQKSERLEEFFEKLISIIYKQPERSRTASAAFARLYLQQGISEEESKT